MRYFLSVILLASLVFSSTYSQTRTFELPLTDESAITNTSFLSDITVITYVDSYKKAESRPERRYIVLNKNLEVVMDTSPEMAFRLKHVAQWSKDSVHIDLFYDYRRGNFQLNQITSKGLKIYHGKLPNKKYDLRIIKREDDLFVLNLNRKKESVIRFNLQTQEQQETTFPSKLKRGKLNIIDWSMDDNGQVNLIYTDANRTVSLNKVITITRDNEINRYDLTGSVLQVARLVSLELGAEIVIGAYGYKPGGTASGIRAYYIEDGSVINATDYPLSKLTHFFDYLSSQDKATVKRRLARLKKHEKSTDVYHYAYLENIQRQSADIITSFSFYNPVYTDLYGVTRNGASIAGSPQQLRGYVHSHGLLLRFDSLANLLHDDFVAYDSTIVQLSRSTESIYHVSDSLYTTLYLAKDGVKLIQLEPHEPITRQEVDTDSVVTEGAITTSKKLGKYYGQHLLLHGYQTKKDSSSKKRQRIYFIEKRKLP